jgi:hypothetical protein
MHGLEISPIFIPYLFAPSWKEGYVLYITSYELSVLYISLLCTYLMKDSVCMFYGQLYRTSLGTILYLLIHEMDQSEIMSC